MSISGEQTDVLDLEAGFDQIMTGEFSPAFETAASDPAAAETPEIPFGPFTPDDDVVGTVRRLASLTSTGYSGNNSEESC